MASFRKRKGGWNVQVRRSGFPNLSRTFIRKTEGQTWARDVEVRLERDGLITPSKPELRSLGDILNRYVRDITSKKRGAGSESLRIGKILRHSMCSIKLLKLSSMDIASYRDERLQEVAAASVVMELMLISHAIDTAAREWGVALPDNVVRNVTKPKVDRGRDRRLLAGEEQRLLLACSQSRNYWLHPVVVMAIETGMRREELLNQSWKDIDLDKQVARLEMTKNGTKRDVPLSSKAIETLGSLPHDITGKVFPLSAVALRGLWKGPARRLELLISASTISGTKPPAGSLRRVLTLWR